MIMLPDFAASFLLLGRVAQHAAHDLLNPPAQTGDVNGGGNVLIDDAATQLVS